MDKSFVIYFKAMLGGFVVLVVSSVGTANWDIQHPQETIEIFNTAKFGSDGNTDPDMPQGATCTVELYEFIPSQPGQMGAFLGSFTGTKEEGVDYWRTAPGDKFDPSPGVWPEGPDLFDLLLRIRRTGTVHDVNVYDVVGP